MFKARAFLFYSLHFVSHFYRTLKNAESPLERRTAWDSKMVSGLSALSLVLRSLVLSPAPLHVPASLPCCLP